MTAATKDRDTKEVIGAMRSFPLAANAVIHAGTMVALNAAGYLVPAATSTTLKCVGVARTPANNTNGADGAVSMDVHRGFFGPFANSAAGDLIGTADIGADCYVVDDQTVAKTNGGSTRSVAGKVHQVETSGVWVRFD